jgi:hypothetical protein
MSFLQRPEEGSEYYLLEENNKKRLQREGDGLLGSVLGRGETVQDETAPS